jgi:hypothetical protein
MDTNLDRKTSDRRFHQIAGGVILILAGVAFLLTLWLDISMYVVLMIGVGMLALGIFSRSNGWIIPGGVLSGIGLGILVFEGPWKLPLADQPRSGIFLLCFAFGWFVITLLSGLVNRKTLWWPLIPGGIMALLGGIIWLVSDWTKVQVASTIIESGALILIGIYLLFRWSQTKQS